MMIFSQHDRNIVYVLHYSTVLFYFANWILLNCFCGVLDKRMRKLSASVVYLVYVTWRVATL